MKIEHVAKEFFVSLLGGVSNQGYHNEKTGFRSYFISFEDGARLEIMSKSLFSWEQGKGR